MVITANGHLGRPFACTLHQFKLRQSQPFIHKVMDGMILYQKTKGMGEGWRDGDSLIGLDG